MSMRRMVIGMSASSSGLLSFKSPVLPKRILLDSNFVLNLTTNLSGFSGKHVSDCVNFGSALEKNGTLIYVTDWVINEVCHQIYMMKLAEEIHSTPTLQQQFKSPYDLYLAKPGSIQKHHVAVMKVVELLGKLALHGKLEENSYAIREKSLSLMRTFNLLPTDAYILATALINKVEAIATLNVRDFGKIARAKIIKVFTPESLV